MPDEEGTLEIGTNDWDGRGVMLSVRDNGCGIAAENLAKVFDPFFTTKKQGQGTGLGLSVSYSLMRHYGGKITVRSEEGQWTEFRVWILAEPEFVEEEETLMEKLAATDESGMT
jgi:two-component system, NtrC family, sensor kinase